MVRILDHLRRKYRFGYPEKVEFCSFDPEYITLTVVVANNREGYYFRIVLRAENFITGYNAVEGFVSLRHAFQVKLEQQRGGEMMALEADFYHCHTCGIVPWNTVMNNWRRCSCPNPFALMRGQVNGRQSGQIPTMLTRPHDYQGRARILNVTSSFDAETEETRYQLDIDVRGWCYTTTIKRRRPHFEWVEHHLQRGLLTGSNVIIAATLRNDRECGGGKYELALWRIVLWNDTRHPLFTDIICGVSIP
ncbi:hypothetical protein ACHWQZ_G004351 [Mnemiopsis leidyi]